MRCPKCHERIVSFRQFVEMETLFGLWMRKCPRCDAAIRPGGLMLSWSLLTIAWMFLMFVVCQRLCDRWGLARNNRYWIYLVLAAPPFFVKCWNWWRRGYYVCDDDMPV